MADDCQSRGWLVPAHYIPVVVNLLIFVSARNIPDEISNTSNKQNSSVLYVSWQLKNSSGPQDKVKECGCNLSSFALGLPFQILIQ